MMINFNPLAPPGRRLIGEITGKDIAEAREELQITRKQLALMLGRHVSNISRLERNLARSRFPRDLVYLTGYAAGLRAGRAE